MTAYADEPLVIDVQPVDIAMGERGSATHCAVARAIRRAIPARHVEVMPSTVAIDGTRWITPEALRLYIRRFDRGSTVRPAVFHLTTREV